MSKKDRQKRLNELLKYTLENETDKESSKPLKEGEYDTCPHCGLLILLEWKLKKCPKCGMCLTCPS
jgi:RNA polymerase-binding transcription factor DksA